MSQKEAPVNRQILLVFILPKFISPLPFIHPTYLNATFIIWPACICNAYCK